VDIRGAQVAVIMQCVGVWIVAGKFGCSWNVLQMRVKLPTVQRGFAFNTKALEDEEEDEDEDEDVEDDATASAAPPARDQDASAQKNDQKKNELFESDEEDQ
jgi:hypothetical protein